MDRREMLDELWDISQALEKKADEIRIDGLYMNLKDIQQDFEKMSTRVMELWENLDGMKDVAERALEREAV